MRIFKASAIAFISAVALSSAAYAQRNCVRGIPCGGTCISASRTCHVGGSPQQQKPPETAAAAPPPVQQAVAAPAIGSTTTPNIAAAMGSPIVGIAMRVTIVLGDQKWSYDNVRAEIDPTRTFVDIYSYSGGVYKKHTTAPLTSSVIQWQQ